MINSTQTNLNDNFNLTNDFCLKQCLKILPENFCELAKLYFEEKKSLEEIARIKNVPAKEVQSQIEILNGVLCLAEKYSVIIPSPNFEKIVSEYILRAERINSLVENAGGMETVNTEFVCKLDSVDKDIFINYTLCYEPEPVLLLAKRLNKTPGFVLLRDADFCKQLQNFSPNKQND